MAELIVPGSQGFMPTGGMPNGFPSGANVIPINLNTNLKGEIGKNCIICGEFIPMQNPFDSVCICETCAKKLKALLYPVAGQDTESADTDVEGKDSPSPQK